jgi:hypothetical protein
MIAEFKETTIKPMRFRITDEEGEQHTFDITGYIIKATEKHMNNTIFKFECNIVINDNKRSCEVWYNRDTCKWTLYRI